MYSRYLSFFIVLLGVLYSSLVPLVSFAQPLSPDKYRQRLSEGNNNLDGLHCDSPFVDGHEFTMSLYVDPSGGDACTKGALAGWKRLTADSSNKVHFSCESWLMGIHNSAFKKMYPEVQGVPMASPQYKQYYRIINRAYTSERTTYCAKLGQERAESNTNRKVDRPLPASRFLRLHGILNFWKPRITVEIRNGRATVIPRQACCTENRECVGEVLSGREQCPSGSYSAGNNTNCESCDDPEAFSPPTHEQSVACCVSSSCEDIAPQKCSELGGEILPGNSSCSASSGACNSVTGACIPTAGRCIEGQTHAECLAIDQNARFLRGQRCPKETGGCCDPLGLCRVTTETECKQKKDSFFPAGCPEQCPVYQGACTLSCPNGLGLKCMMSTARECASGGGASFNPTGSCPTDPVLLKCDPPPCHKCQELIRGNGDYWPTMFGQLYLSYYEGGCYAEFVDQDKQVRRGEWECLKEKFQDRVRLHWPDGSKVTLRVIRDGQYVQALEPEQELIEKKGGPCGRVPKNAKPDGKLKYRGAGYKDFVISGKYICPIDEHFYVERGDDFYTVYRRKDPKSSHFEYDFRVQIAGKQPESDGSTTFAGFSIDDKTMTPRSPWQFNFFGR